MDTIQFDLITPEKVFFSGSATQIDIAGSEGDFGVLPGHAPLISTLRNGILKIFTGGEGSKRFFVAGGIAEVNPNSCSVLAERAIDLDNMTRPEAEKTLEKAKETLDKSYEETAKSAALRDLEIAQEVLAAL